MLSGFRIGAGTGRCPAFAGVDGFGYWCWESDGTALLSHNGPQIGELRRNSVRVHRTIQIVICHQWLNQQLSDTVF